jgi:hypothetical protein
MSNSMQRVMVNGRGVAANCGRPNARLPPDVDLRVMWPPRDRARAKRLDPAIVDT